METREGEMGDTVIAVSHDESNVRLLYEAAKTGSVEALNSLLTKDSLILHKLSLTSFSDTPLHVSSLLGHAEFTESLISRHPKLVLERDINRRTALHLAAAEGHLEIARVILRYCPESKELSSTRDRDGRTPLHLAAMRDRAEIAKEMARAFPEFIDLAVLDQATGGETTVFHLCVAYNSLDVLKALVESGDYAEKLLDFRDHEGNTILHLAAMQKQPEVVRFLLSLPHAGGKVNMPNGMGWTAFDVVAHSSKDFDTLQIYHLLMELNAHRAREVVESNQNIGISCERAQVGSSYLYPVDDVSYGQWLEKVRGNLMIVATVIATMSFQSAVNPPGGVWEVSAENFRQYMQPNTDISDVEHLVMGTAVAGYNIQYGFILFTIFNTTSFYASLSVILLLISGVSHKNRLLIKLLTLMMCISIATLGAAYAWSMVILAPSFDMVDVPHWPEILYKTEFGCWICLFGLIILVHFVKFVKGRKPCKGAIEKLFRILTIKRSTPTTQEF